MSIWGDPVTFGGGSPGPSPSPYYIESDNVIVSLYGYSPSSIAYIIGDRST